MTDRLVKILIAALVSWGSVAALPGQALPFQPKAKFVGLTKVVKAGNPCSVTVQTEPGSLCQITVKKPNGGASRHPNLVEKRSDAAGTINWSWQMVEDAQPGERLVIVKCILKDNSEVTIQKKMMVR
jgi:hypothetical protein